MANVIQFIIKGVDKFSGPLGKVDSKLKATFNIVKAGAKITAAFAAATGGLALAFAKSQDETAKFAAKLGATTEEMSRLHHAAEFAGVSIRTMDMAAQRATRRIAEAAQGTGEAKSAIQELGLEARALNQMPLEQKMAALADALEGVENQSDKVRLAFKLFDSEGVSMVNMLGKGSEALRAAAADAERLGIVLDQQAAANSEAFMDQFKRMGDSMKGFGMAIANRVIPFITEVMEKTANWIADNRERIVNFGVAVVHGFLTAYYVIQDTLDGIADLMVEVFTSSPAQVLRTFLDNVKATFVYMFDLAVETIPLILTVIKNTFTMAAQIMWESMKWAWDNIKALFTGDEGVSFAELFTARIPEAIAQTKAQMATALDDMGTIAFRTMEEVGEAIGDTLGVSVEDASARATAAMGSFSNAAVRTVEDVNTATRGVGGLNPFDEEGIVKGSEEYKKKLQEAFDALDDSLKSQATLLEEQYLHERNILAAYYEGKEGMEAEHQGRLAALQQSYVDAVLSANMTRTERLQAAYDEELEAFNVLLQNKLISQQEYEEELLSLRQDYSNQGLEVFSTVGEEIQARVTEWLENMRSLQQTYADLMMESVDKISAGVGDAFAQAIVYGKNLTESLKKMAQAVLANIIKTLVQYGVQRVLLSGILQGAVRADAAAEGSKAVGLAGANMFASMAAAPWPINLTAPAWAAAYMAGAANILASGAALGGAVGASVIGAAAEGMDYIPKTGTYLIHEGERVIKPEQNRDLTAFLAEGAGGGTQNIDSINIEVLPNATNAESLLNMDSADWNDVVAGPIMDALNLLNRKGVKPDFAEAF